MHVTLSDTNTQLTVVRAYPVTAMTAFEGDEMARFHTCLSAKTYFRFARDNAQNSANPDDEPSSEEEDDDAEEEAEVLCQVQATRRSQRLSQGTAVSSSGSAPPATAPSPLTPITTTGPLRRDVSLSYLSSLPPKIWGNPWVPSHGRFAASIVPQSPADEQVYQFATGDSGDGLYVTGSSADAIAVKFSDMLGDAAERADFSNILQAQRSFVVCV